MELQAEESFVFGKALVERALSMANVGCRRKKATPEIPKAKGTGIPINIKRKNRITTNVIFITSQLSIIRMRLYSDYFTTDAFHASRSIHPSISPQKSFDL